MAFLIFFGSFIVLSIFWQQADRRYDDAYVREHDVALLWHDKQYEAFIRGDTSNFWSPLYLLRKQNNRRLDRLRILSLGLFLSVVVVPFSLFVCMLRYGWAFLDVPNVYIPYDSLLRFRSG